MPVVVAQSDWSPRPFSLPPTRVVTTGTPHAKVSISALHQPSQRVAPEEIPTGRRWRTGPQNEWATGICGHMGSSAASRVFDFFCEAQDDACLLSSRGAISVSAGVFTAAERTKRSYHMLKIRMPHNSVVRSRSPD